MATNAFILLTLLEALVIGGLFLIYPRIARRGLLFGVYVGEERWDGDEAREIAKSWQVSIVVWTIVSVCLGMGLFLRFRSPIVAPVSPLVLTAGCLVLYLRAYFRARSLAAPGPPAAVAVLAETKPSTILPTFVLMVGVLGGVVALSYATMHYADLPSIVPTHFGPSGKPDAWHPKSFWTVMLLPLLTLVLGVGMGGMVFFTSRAKRAIRFPQTQISVEAQTRFRQAVTRLLSGIAIVVTVMLTVGSISSIRVGLGLATGLSPIMMVLAIGLGLFAIGGTLYLAFHYGQGGARLERAAGNAPLTDGLADNRHWVLGTFYVNRDDPSIFVERRFGFGYTINFGNWKAVALLAGFLVVLLGLAAAAIVKNG